MPSRAGRSTDPPSRPHRRSPGVEVYLLPAIVGGGLGDIEEVLAAGRVLARAGFPIRLYRSAGRPLPPGVEGPWEWPRLRRVDRVRPAARAALTVTPAWGVSAAPARSGPLGRPGPWAEEVADLERTYGPKQVLHVSLEEFARTLDAREENRERLREGGVRAREIPRRLRDAERTGELDRYRAAFERFRAFDRPNVLHLFATFRPDRRFARAFPRAVQTGPLWPGWNGPRVRAAARRSSRSREWVWYASPASAERIAAGILEGLCGARPPVHLYVRSPRPWPTIPASSRWTLETRPAPPAEWHRRFARAELRIVTGSRSLLEALELDGPFLYFNGVLGKGPHTRRHRPEKIRALLAAGREQGVPASLLADLARFARGEDILGVVRRLAEGTGGWERFRPEHFAPNFSYPYQDLGGLLADTARALSRPGADSYQIVGRIRRRQNG